MDEDKQEMVQRKRLFDQAKKDYLEANNHNVDQIWECEWRGVNTQKPIKF